MNKVKEKKEMRAEYDFSKGVRGKHFEKVKNGYKTIINNEDGSTVIKESHPIYLDEDVKKFFPNSDSVNQALRGLIALIPEKHT